MHSFIFFITLLLQPAPLYVVSPDFEDGGTIPRHCTCDGMNTNPTLIIHGIPEGTKSLTLVVEDADSPLEPEWLVWNIPPVETLDAQTLSGLMETAKIGTSYRGPCPENESIKTYAFKVYALDTVLSIPPDGGRAEIEAAMADHVMASGKLQGSYSRSVVMGSKDK